MRESIPHKNADGQILSSKQAEQFMFHALELAKRGAGKVAPNPLVGAVLVANGSIIGQGYHRQFGGPHAEIECLDSVKPALRHLIAEADLFVTLEPCAHFGKTPPCADRIVREKISRVWIACRDPFPEVNGKGIAKLEAAGIRVNLGVLEKECTALNKRFFCFHNRKRPYIILKWAETVDGYIAHPPTHTLDSAADRLLISNEWSQRIVHRWRSEEAAILVGWKTAMADNPQLNNRYWPEPSPLRVLIDRQLQVPATHHLFQDGAPTIIYNGIKSDKKENVEWVELSHSDHFLKTVLQNLHQRKIQSVLIEGGAGILTAFIEDNLWDEARIIRNQHLAIGIGLLAPLLPLETILSQEAWQGDLHITHKNPAVDY